MQILLTYLESDKNVTYLSKEGTYFMFVGNLWIFFLLTVTQTAFTSHVYLTLDTEQSDQQTNLLLILLRGKIHMIMI